MNPLEIWIVHVCTLIDFTARSHCQEAAEPVKGPLLPASMTKPQPQSCMSGQLDVQLFQHTAQEHTKHFGVWPLASRAACKFMHIELFEVLPYMFPFLRFSVFSPYLTTQHNRHRPSLQAAKTYSSMGIKLGFPPQLFISFPPTP